MWVSSSTPKTYVSPLTMARLVDLRAMARIKLRLASFLAFSTSSSVLVPKLSYAFCSQLLALLRTAPWKMWDPFAAIPWSALRLLQLLVSNPPPSPQHNEQNSQADFFHSLRNLSGHCSRRACESGGPHSRCTGQALAVDTESELFHDWSGVKVICHQTATEEYPEQIQALLERAHNKLADRNENAAKIVERLMFMVQQSSHDTTSNKTSRVCRKLTVPWKRIRPRRQNWKPSTIFPLI
jgi:hypothetical protein